MNPSDEQALSEGCYYSQPHADRVHDFFVKFLRHSKGQWAGKPFTPLDWQREQLINPLFGWRRKDGSRRFRKCDLFVAKKNGKTTVNAGLALYLLSSDYEERAEVYCAAGDKDQASILYREMKSLVEGSPGLRRSVRMKDSKKQIEYRNSFFRVLSSEAHTKEGYDASAVIIDELHVQPDRVLYDTLLYAGAARHQPLQISISTAGFDTDSLCYEQWQYAEKVNRGEIIDPSYYGLIYTVPTDLDWKDPAYWHLANPSLGETIRLDEMQEKCREAVLLPSRENTFRRYRLNQWTAQDVKWVPLELWDELPEADPDDSPWYAGLDLSATQDLTAFVLYQPKTGCVKAFFWYPEETEKVRERLAKVKLRQWKDFIHFCPGRTIDYEKVRGDIVKIASQHKIKQIGVDPWNAVETSNKLKSLRFNVESYPQNFGHMSFATKELERLVLNKKIFPKKNPVLRWCLNNIRVETDASGNIKPTKARSADKIDGIVALIMAIGLSVADPKKTSKYNSEGIVEV